MTISQTRQKGAELLIRSTKAFIDDDPTTVVAMPERGEKIDRPGGGHDWEPAQPRDPQTVKLISQGTANGGKTTNTTTYSEEVQKFPYVMVTMPDATFARGDTWHDGNTKYSVTAELPNNGYERKFEVEGIGADPNYG